MSDDAHWIVFIGKTIITSACEIVNQSGDCTYQVHMEYVKEHFFTTSNQCEGSATGRNIVHYGRNFKKYDRSMERSIGISANLGVKGISANLGVKGISGNFLGIHRSSEKHKGVQRE